MAKIAQGAGWLVLDKVCTLGPRDRRFEEQHAHPTIAMVIAGTFQYRSRAGHDLMSPGSLLLGNRGQYFECGHEHGTGDRCVSFRYDPEYLDRVGSTRAAFRRSRVPPDRALTPLIARACAALRGATDIGWEELALDLAAVTMRLNAPRLRDRLPNRRAVARVTDSVRMIVERPHAAASLRHLACEAGLSPYHYLRTFERVTGVTPHQFVLRTRLRHAALQLMVEPRSVLEVAMESGFGDLSNFNRAFRAEFGVSPRAYRHGLRGAKLPAHRLRRALEPR